ncbi:MAG: hypothetical protein AAF557_24450 [Pseudomonadota bacterium]
MAQVEHTLGQTRMEAVAPNRMNTIRNPEGAQAAAFGLGLTTKETEGTSPREMMT